MKTLKDYLEAAMQIGKLPPTPGVVTPIQPATKAVNVPQKQPSLTLPNKNCANPNCRNNPNSKSTKLCPKCLKQEEMAKKNPMKSPGLNPSTDIVGNP
jgi:hypothetical protein